MGLTGLWRKGAGVRVLDKCMNGASVYWDVLEQ